ncbi:MAG: hypothetical protein CM15mP102_17940 [Flavobacteriales bacterium]|nr:MAG: hypothetical protein CM15mP102_17940 [Flavobacteriales bacterium]
MNLLKDLTSIEGGQILSQLIKISLLLIYLSQNLSIQKT